MSRGVRLGGRGQENDTPTSQLPVEISSQLFLGDARACRDVPRLRERGITAVLNVAGPPAAGPIADYKAAGIAYKEIPADDEEVRGEGVAEAWHGKVEQVDSTSPTPPLEGLPHAHKPPRRVSCLRGEE